MKKLLLFSVLLFGVALVANSQHVMNSPKTLYLGETTHLNIIAKTPDKVTAISVTVRVISGNITINSYTYGSLVVTGNSVGNYEIEHFTRYSDGSTVLNKCYGQIECRNCEEIDDDNNDGFKPKPWEPLEPIEL